MSQKIGNTNYFDIVALKISNDEIRYNAKGNTSFKDEDLHRDITAFEIVKWRSGYKVGIQMFNTYKSTSLPSSQCYFNIETFFNMVDDMKKAYNKITNLANS